MSFCFFIIATVFLYTSCYTQELEDNEPLSILMLNGLFAGHLFPLVSLGEELIQRGHNVTLCSTVMNGSKLLPNLPESVGITFLHAGTDIITLEDFNAVVKDQKDGLKANDVADFGTVARESVVKMINTLENYGIHNFDVIICDFSNIPPGLHYAVLGSRVIAFSSMLPPYPSVPSPWPIPFTLTGGQSENLSFLERLLNSFLHPLLIRGWNYFLWSFSKHDTRLRETLSGIDFMRYPGTHIPHLIASVIGFDVPALQTPLRHYVGPMIKRGAVELPEDLADWLSNKRDKSVLYISMGTTGYVSHERASAIVESVMSSQLNAVWALRQNNRDCIKGIEIDSERIFLSDWLPQTTVLSHSAIALSILHCGLNSVQESLYYELPVVCLPHAFDHFATGGTLRNILAGISLYDFFDSTNITTHNLESAIRTVLSDEYVANAKRISLLYKFAGGAKTAADLIEYYADVGYDHLVPAFARYHWSWVQYHNVDVYCILLCGLAVLLSCVYRFIRYCLC